MNKVLLLVLCGLLIFTNYYAQQTPFGFKTSKGDISRTFVIKNGFQVDSIRSCDYGGTSPITYKLEYDVHGKVIKTIGFNKINKAIHVNGRWTTILVPGHSYYFYNNKGLTDSISVHWDDSLHEGYSYKYIYDSYGNTKLIRIYMNGLLYSTTDNSYNSFNNLIKSVYVQGNNTTNGTYEYDSQNRLILAKSISSSNSYYGQNVYTYDPSGNMDITMQTVDSGNIENNLKRRFVFDQYDKLVHEIDYRNYNKTNFTWWDSSNVFFSYDSSNKINGMSFMFFNYNSDGNLDSLLCIHAVLAGYLGGGEVSLSDSYGNSFGTSDGKCLKYLYYHSSPTSVENDKAKNDKSFYLSQNYPNPFNPTTTISYSIKERGLVQLQVFNMLGQKVADLVNKQEEAGVHSVEFDALNIPSGVYFYRIHSNNYSATKKLILLK